MKHIALKMKPKHQMTLATFMVGFAIGAISFTLHDTAESIRFHEVTTFAMPAIVAAPHATAESMRGTSNKSQKKH
jgi:hypothetical protein